MEKFSIIELVAARVSASYVGLCADIYRLYSLQTYADTEVRAPTLLSWLLQRVEGGAPSPPPFCRSTIAGSAVATERNPPGKLKGIFG